MLSCLTFRFENSSLANNFISEHIRPTAAVWERLREIHYLV